MTKSNNKHTELMIKLSKGLKDNFAQLYEKIRNGEAPQELWEYTFIDPLMKHFEVKDLEKVIEMAIREFVESELKSDNWMDTDNEMDEILDNKRKFEMTCFLFKARKKHEVRLIDVKNKKEELLDYKKLVVYFYPYSEKNIQELPETVSSVYEENEENELQAHLEILPKGEK